MSKAAPAPAETEAPTEAETTEAPATEAETTEAPATEAETTEAPATEAPAVPAEEVPGKDWRRVLKMCGLFDGVLSQKPRPLKLKPLLRARARRERRAAVANSKIWPPRPRACLERPRG
jgi:hypothetical protein